MTAAYSLIYLNSPYTVRLYSMAHCPTAMHGRSESSKKMERIDVSHFEIKSVRLNSKLFTSIFDKYDDYSMKVENPAWRVEKSSGNSIKTPKIALSDTLGEDERSLAVQFASITQEENHLQTEICSEFHQEAAVPIGSFIDKCDQCGQCKHVLIIECKSCYQRINFDMNDCRCQKDFCQKRINNIMCDTCRCTLKLDRYVICANRLCQTDDLTPNDHDSQIEQLSTTWDSSSMIDTWHSELNRRSLGGVQINQSYIQEKFIGSCSSESDSSDEFFSSNVISSDSSQSSVDNQGKNHDSRRVEISNNRSTSFNSNSPTKIAVKPKNMSDQTYSWVSV